MTVEVRIIPEGIRSEPSPGIFSKKSARKIAPTQYCDEDYSIRPSSRRSKHRITHSSEADSRINRPSYHHLAAATISRMQAENKQENARVRPRTIRRLMMRQLQAADPNANLAELEKFVDRLLPKAMEQYRGPPVLTPDISEETKNIWKARDIVRRKIVKSNKLRRKMDQPLSSADRKWVGRSK